MTGDEARRQLYRPQEAAPLLGVTPETLARWADAGQLTALRTFGGHRRYSKPEIDALVRQQEEGAQ